MYSIDLTRIANTSNLSQLLMLLIWVCWVAAAMAVAAPALDLNADAWSYSQLPKFTRSQLISGSRRSAGGASGGTFDPNGKSIASRLQGRRTRCCRSRSAAAADLRAAHKISSLPGQPGSVDFDQYGGYVTVDEAKGHALFYYFVEAQRHEAATRPLVLWLNGGPGCSSLGYGALEEIGPFRVNSDRKTLSTNKYAWNNVANVIFLEAPVGVGFSYSNTSSDYDSSGDESTVDAANLFLVEWLELFPEYRGRLFFITGESYAGHYAPQLAATILLLNKRDNNNTITINLQGVMVGNPYLDKVLNEKGRLDYFWSHGLISYEIFENISMKCFSDGTDVASCISVALYAYDMGPINIYNIYAPLCIDTPNGAPGYYYPSGNFHGSYDPCSDKYTSGYLNDPAVQSAFHARMANWSLCVDLTWNWKDAPISMVPTIRWLISEGLPVWIYSGDFDSVCPPVATWYSIHELGLHITTPWRPWTVNKKVGGYVQQYMGGFTFASIREAAHDAPSYQPERALILFKSFLKRELPPYVI